MLVALAACGGGGGASTIDGGGQTDAAVGPDGPAGCARTPAAADRTRYVVVAHPFDAAGAKANAFEVLELSTTGQLSRPNRTFELGNAFAGTIAFTPDGEVGLVAQEDGTVGVFRLDAAGTPTVVHAGFAGSFYASQVVVDPRGDRAWVIDSNTRENGGGLYLVTIGCDGALTDHGLVAPARLPHRLVIDGDHAILAAGNILDGMTAGHDVQLVRWGDAPAHVAGVDAFGDDEALIGGAALTADGKTYLVGDFSPFSGVDTRVAVVGVEATGLVARQVLSPIADPQGIATSPFGDVAVVSCGEGDALLVLDTGGQGGAWRVRGEVSYAGAGPQLSGDVVMIDQGALRGHVLVSELSSVRHLAFRDTGAVEDLGSLSFGSGLQNIGGAIGVTP